MTCGELRGWSHAKISGGGHAHVCGDRRSRLGLPATSPPQILRITPRKQMLPSAFLRVIQSPLYRDGVHIPNGLAGVRLRLQSRSHCLRQFRNAVIVLTPKRPPPDPRHHQRSVPTPSPPPRRQPLSLWNYSVSINLPVLGILHKGNHTMCGLL